MERVNRLEVCSFKVTKHSIGKLVHTCKASGEKAAFDRMAAPCISAQSLAFSTTSFSTFSSSGNGMHGFSSDILNKEISVATIKHRKKRMT